MERANRMGASKYLRDEEIADFIRNAHEAMASTYGDLDLYGQVPTNTLPHWNYLRNVKGPIAHAVRRFLPLRRFTMLDAGCGNGQLFHLYKELGAEVIYGVDFSLAMLKEAEHRAFVNGIRFHPVLGRLEELGFFLEGVFHLINLYGIVEHLPDPIKVLKELERLTMRGGLIVFSIPRWGSLAWLTYRLFCDSIESLVGETRVLEKFTGRRKMSLYRFYRAREIKEMINALPGMELVVRSPVAPGGMVGMPAKPLILLAARGRYGFLDRWDRLTSSLRLTPAGEYVVLRKRSQQE